ncbi:MAG TPA: phosphate acyltransferase PlsX [Elusimicrobiales bacterium]|nr:phosphate acyltransferase PlsX [Elusimicrobiales bacterium]HPO95953.1 phosphate acyltransferase PlsX [Elusimicrobiales bacterium]
MKLCLDAHGGDFGLRPNIEAAIKAVSELGVGIVLVGREKEIREEFRRLGQNEIPKSIEILDCKDIIDMGKEPVEECKSKPESSIMVGCELVGDKKADAFVSAGNSGAIMVSSLLKIGRIKGVARPAITVPFPTENGFSLLLDAGANMDSKPYHLLQFAIMGSIYMKNVAGISNPKVGILSIGEEETKGNSLVIETIPLLKNCKLINYYGPVEGRNIPYNLCDVVVTDGFTGNVVLKLSEGLSKFLFKEIKNGISKSFIYKLGALMMKGVFSEIRKKTNPDEFGGAPLLGIDGVVIVSHGKSSSYAIFNALKNAKKLVSENIIEKMRAEIEQSMDSVKSNAVNGEVNERV